MFALSNANFVRVKLVFIFMVAGAWIGLAHATDLSDFPLASTTTEAVKPNIFLILDDSGSMDRDYMPDDVDTTEVGYRSYQCNSIYYNPGTDYVVPKDSTGVNLHNASPARYTAACDNGYDGSTCNTNLGTSYYWQYVGTATNLAWPASGSNDCTLGSGVDITTRSGVCSGGGSLSATTYPIPTTANCVTVYGGGQTLVWKRVTMNSAAADALNYANWYSYYRTRLMMMKAAVGRSFQGISDQFRVGFMTISPGTYGNSQTSTGAATGNSISASKFLKIADFSTTHRADWFNKLYSQTTSNYTPLRSALSTAGRYFAGKNDLINKGMIPAAADDPVQYSCQQNFTILTTDGYWNSGSGRQLDGTSQIGNQDGVIGELDAYNTITRYEMSPRPIYDGAMTTYVWNSASMAYRTTACTVRQTRTAVTMRSTSQLQATQTTIRDATTNIIVTSASSGGNVSVVTINGADRLPTTVSVSGANGAARRSSVASGLYNNLNGGGYRTIAWGACTGSNAPVSGCTSNTDYYVTVAAPEGAGNVTFSVGFTASNVSLSAANFSGGGTIGPVTVGVSSCTVGTVASNVYTDVQTSACNTVTTGPTGVANTTSCTAATAAAGNNWTTTTCNTTYGSWTDTASCTTANGTAGNGWTETQCRNNAAGTKIQYQSTTTSTTYPGPDRSGTVIGTPTTSTSAWTDLTGTCYGSVAVPALPTGGPVTGSGPPTPPANCSSGSQVWPCETVSVTGGSSNTLADVAQYYYKTDLRTSALGNCTGALGVNVCDNNVPASGTGKEDDRANWQHMSTFTMGLGLDGTLTFTPTYKQVGASTTFESLRGGGINWPVPTADTATAIDDLWHAAVNGRGQYFSARNPDTVVDSLNTALAGISRRVGAAAAAATSNLEPVAGDNFAYMAKYVTKEWSGQLEARELDLSTGQPKDSVLWSVAEKLDALVGSACDNRNIKLFRSGATDNLIDFKWNTAPCNSDGTPGSVVAGSLSSAEKAHFQASGADTTGVTLNEVAQLSQYPNMSDGTGSPATVNQRTLAEGANLVNFLRGQRGLEGFDSGPPPTANEATKLYRSRAHVLGDVISAQPVFVKAPPADYTDAGYTNFRENVKARTPVVYLAANDGMLHAFKATAWQMTLDADGNSVPINSGTANAPVYTADTTGGTELWAFIPTMALPNLHKLASENYATEHKFFVDGTPTVGDIYNPPAPAGSCSDTSNAGNCWRTILVGGLNKGGQGYYALDVTNPAAPKGLWEFKASTSCVTVDATTKAPSGDYYADCHLGYTYNNPVIAKLADGRWVVFVTSGYNNDDGQGYLYVLDANTGKMLYRIGTGVGSAGDQSGLNHIAAYVDKASVNNTVLRVYGADLKGNVWRFDVNDSLAPAGREASLLMQAVDGSGNPQPITTRPMLAEVNGEPFVYVATGRYLGTTDTANTDRQSVWAVKETFTTVTTPRTTLGQRNLSNVGSGTGTYRIVTAGSCLAGDGWYVDLPDNGERVNVDPKLQLGTLIVPSNVPETNACNYGGYGYINYFDYKTGCAVGHSADSVIGGATGRSIATSGPNIGQIVDQNGTPVTAQPVAGSRVSGTGSVQAQVVGTNVVRLPDGKTVVIVTMSNGDTIVIDVPFDTPAPTGKRVTWREVLQ
jgi:type IV pilus assembly protein PilY1